MEIKIRESTIAEVIALSREVPEFFQTYSENTYEERLSQVQNLILIAAVDDKPVGFKIGYRRYKDDVFYSWLRWGFGSLQKNRHCHQIGGSARSIGENSWVF